MRRNLSYLFSLTPGIVTIWGNLTGGHWVFSNLIYSLVFLALTEWVIAEDRSNESDERSFLPDAILILHVVMQVLSLSALFYSIHLGKISGIDLIGAALSTGVHTGSSSIIVAHEMIHRKETIWQLLGKFLLLTAGNCYFFVEHLRVHHKWVGTAKDPATARYGENVYSFFLRSITGQISGAWKLESHRLKADGRSIFSLNNYVLFSIVFVLIVDFLLYIYAGLPATAVFMLQIFFANFLLEYTNYIEHYGLERKENERVREEHSWQTDKLISRFTLVDLSRHSDHHYYASKPYHTLQRYEGSPELPGGYASAIYLALFPPLWFRVVNKRLEKFRKGATA